VWWPEDKNSPNVTHACCKRWLKWVTSAWGKAGSPCLLRSQIRRPGPPGWGFGICWQPHPIEILLSGNRRKAMVHDMPPCQRWWKYVRIRVSYLTVSTDSVQFHSNYAKVIKRRASRVAQSVVSGYGLEDWAFQVRSLAEAKGFFL
jgi:hypothetical protein